MAFARSCSPAVSQLNVTPLIDVMMVLLVIFMVSAPLLERNLTLNLPVASPQPPPPPVDTVTLRIDEAGALFWNGMPLSPATLHVALQIEADREPQPLLQIDSADGTPYAQVAALLADAQGVGLARIGLGVD